MHETKKINSVLCEKLRWSRAELQYAWCDWQLGLKLFIIQYGWLSDEAMGGGRERESEQKRSRCRYDAFCSALAG